MPSGLNASSSALTWVANVPTKRPSAVTTLIGPVECATRFSRQGVDRRGVPGRCQRWFRPVRSATPVGMVNSPGPSPMEPNPMVCGRAG